MSDFDDFDDPELRDGQFLRTNKYKGGRAGYKTRKVRPICPRLVASSASGGASREAGGASGENAAGPAAAAAPAVAEAPAAATGKDERAKECTRSATFMFKGGVYKTMTTILTASALAAPPFNKRVLIVDGDSQCNATSFFMPEPRNWQDEQTWDEQDSQDAGVGAEHLGGASSASESKISLSEKDVSCPKMDPMSKSFFKNDTWLESAINGEKILTIWDLLIPASEFDQGRGS